MLVFFSIPYPIYPTKVEAGIAPFKSIMRYLEVSN